MFYSPCLHNNDISVYIHDRSVITFYILSCNHVIFSERCTPCTDMMQSIIIATFTFDMENWKSIHVGD